MSLERLKLDGQVVIVTGASQGVGKGIATVLAEAGATVVCSARTQADLDQTVKELRGLGYKAEAMVADVMKRTDLQRLCDETFSRFGRIDVLINNAGGGNYKPFLEVTEAEFKREFDWNTTSAFLLSQMVVPHMLRAGKGSIINISSALGHIGLRGMVPYCVSKAALDHLTRALAQELAPKIRVNALALGATSTPALERIFELDPSFKQKLVERTPLKSVGDVYSVGLAALYLCSSAGAYITGAILNIDGGLQDSNSAIRLPDL